MADVPMDEADLAFQGSLVPDDCIPMGFLAIAAWIDTEGDRRWKVYTQLDMVLSEQIGLLEIAKLELIRRTCPDLYVGDDDA